MFLLHVFLRLIVSGSLGNVDSCSEFYHLFKKKGITNHKWMEKKLKKVIRIEQTTLSMSHRAIKAIVGLISRVPATGGIRRRKRDR